MFKRLFAWVYKYERRLSAAAVLGGFIFDNIFFDRIDEVITHQVFVSYLFIAAAAIALRHYFEERLPEGTGRPKWHSLFPIGTQFAFGGLWSGFLIFYSRSGDIAASWPFLLLLAGIFIGNEVFRKYHEKLVFHAVLLFFALYSYAIFSVPLLTKQLGTGTFILSGVAALIAFSVFLFVLRRAGHFRLLKSIWQIRFLTGTVFLALNIFYFANVLPPLPLALSDGGVYHRVERSGEGYIAEAEKDPWYAAFGFPPTLHTAPGGRLYAFSAIFAPIDLSTTVVHEWQWYSEARSRWETRLTVPFTISGGREGGYRGYSVENQLENGSWRVNIKTTDGRLIGRLRFSLELGVVGETELIQL